MHQLELWTSASHAAAPRVRRARVVTAEGFHRTATSSDARATVLDPLLVQDAPRVAELAHLRSVVAGFVQQSRAEATRRAYNRDWDAFTAWCNAHGQQPLPATPATLALYLAKLVELGRKYSSIKRARTAIGQVHAATGVARPDRDPPIRVLERGIGRSIGTREHGAPPLCVGELAPNAR